MTRPHAHPFRHHLPHRRRTLLENASVQINAGWKVGLIGRNGAGKSTLLDLIRGVLQPDGGEVSLQKSARVGFLAQEAPGGDDDAARGGARRRRGARRLLEAARPQHPATR